ncbi:hypothetical protein LBMAG48_06210 [Phycisphaerae bacterium]|nr:hypothetical protein LBMAG48_06210 [Phycisphaerae bacterium]
MLVSAGTTLYRVSGEQSQTVETYTGQTEQVKAMTVIPPGVAVANCQPGDVIAFSALSNGAVWRVNNARSGAVTLTQIGTIPNLFVSSAVFTQGKLYVLAGSVNRWELNTQTFARVPPARALFANVVDGIGGMAVSPSNRWYFLFGNDSLSYMNDPPTLGTDVQITAAVGVNVDSCGLEWYGTELWAGILTTVSDELRVGPLNLTTGAFTNVRTVATGITTSPSVGFVAISPPPPPCDDIDFNNNTVFPEDADVIDFFNVLAGGPCSPGNTCNDIDFNNNSVFPEDADVIDFFNILAGGNCP